MCNRDWEEIQAEENAKSLQMLTMRLGNRASEQRNCKRERSLQGFVDGVNWGWHRKAEIKWESASKDACPARVSGQQQNGKREVGLYSSSSRKVQLLTISWHDWTISRRLRPAAWPR